jgi:hypothetical protein
MSMLAMGVQKYVNKYDLVTSVPKLVVGDKEQIVISGGQIIIPSDITVNVEFSTDRINFTDTRNVTGATNTTINLTGYEVQQIRITKTGGLGTLVTVIYTQGDIIPTGGSASTPTYTSVTNNVMVQGTSASGSTVSGNPIQLGAVFNTTKPTVTNGQIVQLQGTNRGELMMAEQYLDTAVDNPNGVYSNVMKPLSGIPTYSPTPFTNFGTSTNFNVRSIACNLYSLMGYNGNAAIRYLQVHNATAPISPGAVPIWIIPVLPGGIGSFDLTDFFMSGLYLSNGLTIAWSTTAGTYTAATAADHITQGNYK